MSFTEEEVSEFKIEAAELLDQAEKSLLALDQGSSFVTEYDAIFRTFHSIKGAAGMMEMLALQSHMHQLENLLVEQKPKPSLTKALIDHFLRGVDCCRKILDGHETSFDHSVISREPVASAPLVTSAPKKPEVPEITKKTTSEVKPRVMVIDDEVSITDLMSEILIPRGFEVIAFNQPEEALRAVDSFRPDVVLTDIMMPVLSGLDVLKTIRKTHADIPVVFVSGHAQKDILLEAIESGVYAVLEKPFSTSKVLALTRNAVEHHRLLHMVNSSINLLMYQFSDLDDFLIAQGKTDIRNVIDHEIKNLLDQRRKLKKSA